MFSLIQVIFGIKKKGREEKKILLIYSVEIWEWISLNIGVIFNDNATVMMSWQLYCIDLILIHYQQFSVSNVRKEDILW
jgi:hypothetical protein